MELLLTCLAIVPRSLHTCNGFSHVMIALTASRSVIALEQPALPERLLQRLSATRCCIPYCTLLTLLFR